MKKIEKGMICMSRTIGIGVQSFEKIREGNYFYVDKKRRIILLRD